MRPEKLTYVTVVFEEEVALLWLQARSAAVHLSPESVAAIIVIDNTKKGLSSRQRAELVAAYGPVSSLVSFIRPGDICEVPKATGWRTQQILKLKVAELVDTSHYVTLDAKNHFVRPVTPEFFVGEDGRSRINVYGYETHPLRPNLERVLTYLGVDPDQYVKQFTATVTPFVLERDTVCQMMADIERRSGQPFATEFVRQDLTEFFLYAGWVLSKGRTLDEAFECTEVACPAVWPKAANLPGVRAAIAAADERDVPVFSVHRRALAIVPPESSQALAQFWVARDLFDSAAQASGFVRDFQSNYERAAKAQRRRDLPAKLRSIPHRVRRKIKKS
ncbi:MAG: DUF6492 family protein [Candidatus Nanopelagicales bacterium]